MAKRSVNPRNRGGIDRTPLVLLKNMKLTIIGPVTEDVYVWNGAGSVVDVDNRDVPRLLQKGLGNKTCCGGTSTPYFEELKQ